VGLSPNLLLEAEVEDLEEEALEAHPNLMMMTKRMNYV
jgi:hypothetical protein